MKQPNLFTSTWSERFRYWMPKIQSSNITEAYSVIQDINIIAADRVLSFGERKMRKLAEEICQAKKVAHLLVINGGAR